MPKTIGIEFHESEIYTVKSGWQQKSARQAPTSKAKQLLIGTAASRRYWLDISVILGLGIRNLYEYTRTERRSKQPIRSEIVYKSSEDQCWMETGIDFGCSAGHHRFGSYAYGSEARDGVS